MKLFALSDLHLANRSNREALAELSPRPDDWLIVAGDVGETEAHLRFALELLEPRFRQLLWVPGNHDLWAVDPEDTPLRGEAKYQRLVQVCRDFGVLTPEDPYHLWPGSGSGAEIVLAPLFLLYDYSFRPDHVTAADAVAWAQESGVLCADESLLDPAPHPSRQAWCGERLRITEQRLAEVAAPGRRMVLINHFPLRRDLVTLRFIPRFSIWCGTRASEDWHLRFRAEAVVYGHLHVRGSRLRNGVRFEEVSLGYPRDWNRDLGVGAYLRQILPPPAP